MLPGQQCLGEGSMVAALLAKKLAESFAVAGMTPFTIRLEQLPTSNGHREFLSGRVVCLNVFLGKTFYDRIPSISTRGYWLCCIQVRTLQLHSLGILSKFSGRFPNVAAGVFK